jgi:uncharacterized small protein (DUF1192 family)
MGLRVAWELQAIESVLAGAQVLADCLSHDQLADENDERVAVTAIPAILGLVRDQLHRLSRVVEGNADPGDLITESNEAATDDDNNGALVLEPWSLPERVRRLQDELERLRRQQERKGESR